MSSSPRASIGRWSAYTVLGLAGYAVASLALGALATATGSGMLERAIAVCVPPFGFWAAIALEKRITHREAIVFYRTAIAAWLLAIATAAAAGASSQRVSDLVALLIVTFLAFGRVGCFRVACCHGKPARFGVRYTHAHAALGFPRRWVGRPVLPVQLIEAAASAALASAGGLALGLGAAPGTTTAILVVGYALVRFPLELLRGDAARPHAAGISEAQWIGLATTLLVAAFRPSVATLGAAVALAAGAAVVARRSRSFEHSLRHPRHLDELEHALAALVRRGSDAPVLSTAGLTISVHRLPTAQLDVLWSAAELEERDARALAADLSLDGEILAGRSPGLFHVVVDPV